MRMRNKIFECVGSIVTLLSVISLVDNTICNGHIHQIANGSIIFHAHPYHKNDQNDVPIKSHQHSRIEFLFFYFIKNLLEDGLVIFFLWIFIFVVKLFRFVLFLNVPSYKLILVQKIRAPPLKYTKNDISL